MLVVREIEAADAEAVAGLTAQLGYQRSAAQITAWLEARDAALQTALLAVFDGMIVGWLEVAIEWRLQSDRCAHIGGLVVAEGHRSSGIGLALCRQAEAWALARGVTLMRVLSRSTREAAHRFYLRDGYELIKHSAVFEKRLAP